MQFPYRVPHRVSLTEERGTSPQLLEPASMICELGATADKSQKFSGG